MPTLHLFARLAKLVRLVLILPVQFVLKEVTLNLAQITAQAALRVHSLKLSVLILQLLVYHVLLVPTLDHTQRIAQNAAWGPIQTRQRLINAQLALLAHFRWKLQQIHPAFAKLAQPARSQKTATRTANFATKERILNLQEQENVPLVLVEPSHLNMAQILLLFANSAQLERRRTRVR